MELLNTQSPQSMGRSNNANSTMVLALNAAKNAQMPN